MQPNPKGKRHDETIDIQRRNRGTGSVSHSKLGLIMGLGIIYKLIIIVLVFLILWIIKIRGINFLVKCIVYLFIGGFILVYGCTVKQDFKNESNEEAWARCDIKSEEIMGILNLKDSYYEHQKYVSVLTECMKSEGYDSTKDCYFGGNCYERHDSWKKAWPW